MEDNSAVLLGTSHDSDKVRRYYIHECKGQEDCSDPEWPTAGSMFLIDG